MNLLDICKKYGMSNPTDIRHWYEDMQNYIDEEKKEFAKLKCAEQRQLCADKAKINVEAKFKKEIRNTQANSYFYDFKEKGGKRDITVYKESIINAPEPTI